jgi:hypothetical protein
MLDQSVGIVVESLRDRNQSEIENILFQFASFLV